MAWAFYGHRQQLYRETKPHMGFSMLLDWGRAMPGGYFVVTSNVDGQFEKAGFPAERILEQHGSIHRMQCSRPCSEHIWLEESKALDIDLENITARGRLPRCPECGDVARPNVLMFVDPDWLAEVTREQEQRYREWLASVRGRRLVIVELGAGTAIATIRMLGERLASERDRVTLVRVNPDATDAEEPVIPVRLGALEALRRIEEKLPEGFREAMRAGDSRSGTAESWKTASAEPPEMAPLTEKIHLHLGALTKVDLGRGVVELDYTGTMRLGDESACMQSYIDAQEAWVPVPELNGLSAPGYTMTAGIFHTPEYDAGGTPGIAIVFVQAPDGDAVITLGMARRASDGPFLWQLLYETSITTLAPLDHPRVPWVARRPDADPMRHARVMPYLNEFERSIAWAWLRLTAFIDATKSKGASA
jgi:NAD-dependent SIR2 family protein deacetylase